MSVNNLTSLKSFFNHFCMKNLTFMNRNKYNFSHLKSQVNISMRNNSLRGSTSLAEDCQYAAVNTQGNDKLFSHSHIEVNDIFSLFFLKQKQSVRSFITVNIVSTELVLT